MDNQTSFGKKSFFYIKNNARMFFKHKWGKRLKISIILFLAFIFLLILSAAIYSIGTPSLRNLPEKTTQASIIVKGFWVQDNANVKIFLNNNLASEIKANDKGEFEATITLNEGENLLYAVADYKNKEKKSVEKKITYINQEKIDAQNRTDAEARALLEEKQKAEIEEQKEVYRIEAENKKADELVAKLKAESEQKAKEEALAKVTGLNISRNTVIQALINLEPGLNFQKGNSMDDGQDNYFASVTSKGINVQLIGTQENLTEISANAFLDVTNREQINDAVAILGTLAGSMRPNDEIKNWLSSEIAYYLANKYKDYTHTKTFGDVKYEIQSILIGDIPGVYETISFVSNKTATLQEKNISNEVGNTPISEETYKARIFSEGEKISKAGLYIIQAGQFYESGTYSQCEEVLYKAADIFRDVNWTFKGQKNPPVKYIKFNENMIVIFSDIPDSIENMATAIADGDTATYTKELRILNNLISKADTEMTKAGF